MRYIVTPIQCPYATVLDSPVIPGWMQQVSDAIQQTGSSLDELAASRSLIRQCHNITPLEVLDIHRTYVDQLRMLLNVVPSSSFSNTEPSGWIISTETSSVQLQACSIDAELVMALYASAALTTAAACQDSLVTQLFSEAQMYLREAADYCTKLSAAGSPPPYTTLPDGSAAFLADAVLTTLISFIDAQVMEIAFTDFIACNKTWSLADHTLQESLRGLLNASRYYGNSVPEILNAGLGCFQEMADLSALKPHILTVAGRLAAAKCLFSEGKYNKCIEECNETFNIVASSMPEEKEIVSISLCIECLESLREQLLELMGLAQNMMASPTEPPEQEAQEPMSVEAAPPEPLAIDLPPMQEPAQEFLMNQVSSSQEIALLNDVISQKNADLDRNQAVIESLMEKISELESAIPTAAPTAVPISVGATDYSTILLAKDQEIERLQQLILSSDVLLPTLILAPASASIPAPNLSLPAEQPLPLQKADYDGEDLQQVVNSLRTQLDKLHTKFCEETVSREYVQATVDILTTELTSLAGKQEQEQEPAEPQEPCVTDARVSDTHTEKMGAYELEIQALQGRVTSLESQLLAAQNALIEANETVALYHQDIIEAEAEAERMQESLLGSQLTKLSEPVAVDVPLTDELILAFANTALEVGGLKASAAQKKIYDELVELAVALETENEQLKKRCAEHEAYTATIDGGAMALKPGSIEHCDSKSVLQTIGRELGLQTVWPHLPSLTSHLQGIVDSATETVKSVLDEYAQGSGINNGNVNNEYEYSHSDSSDSSDQWGDLKPKLFGCTTAVDTAGILDGMLSRDVCKGSSLSKAVARLKALGSDLQTLPTVVISGYDEDKTYDTVSNYILELVAEQHETRADSTEDGYKDVELAHINIVDLRLHMYKTERVVEMYNRFSAGDQARLYELQLLAQRKNSEIVTLVRYMKLLSQAYELSIDTIKQSIKDQACSSKINGVEISTVLLEKDEQITELQEALMVARSHMEQRVADVTRDMYMLQGRYDSLETQIQEFRTMLGAEDRFTFTESDEGICGILAGRDRQIRELNDIIELLRADNPAPVPIPVYQGQEQEQYQNQNQDQEREREQPQGQEQGQTTYETTDSSYQTGPATASLTEGHYVSSAYTHSNANYERILQHKDAEIARLQRLCEQYEAKLDMACADTPVTFVHNSTADSTYGQAANFNEIQRLNIALNDSNSKVQELTESLELLRTKNSATNTALDNQVVQIEELTQEKQKLQNLVIQLTEENLVKSATVQSVMTTSIASSTLATEINNLKAELNERDHEIVRLTHTIEGLNRQIVENAGTEVPQMSTVINIPSDASDNEIIKSLVNSIKTQEASFTHIRTVLKDKQKEVGMLKEALERQEDTVRTLLSNPLMGRMGSSDSTEGNNNLVLTNYNDVSGASAVGSHAVEEARMRYEEKIQKLEEELVAKNNIIDAKSSEIYSLREELNSLERELYKLRAKIADLEEKLRQAEAERPPHGDGQDDGGENRGSTRMLDDYTREMFDVQIKNLYEMLAAKDMEINSYKKSLGIEDGAVFTYV